MKKRNFLYQVELGAECWIRGVSGVLGKAMVLCHDPDTTITFVRTESGQEIRLSALEEVFFEAPVPTPVHLPPLTLNDFDPGTWVLLQGSDMGRLVRIRRFEDLQVWVCDAHEVSWKEDLSAQVFERVVIEVSYKIGSGPFCYTTLNFPWLVGTGGTKETAIENLAELIESAAEEKYGRPFEGATPKLTMSEAVEEFELRRKEKGSDVEAQRERDLSDSIFVEYSAEDEVFVAEYPKYPSLRTHGDTAAEARAEMAQLVLDVEADLRDGVDSCGPYSD